MSWRDKRARCSIVPPSSLRTGSTSKTLRCDRASEQSEPGLSSWATRSIHGSGSTRSCGLLHGCRRLTSRSSGSGSKQEGTLPPNVTSHNELGRDELTTVLSESDVAFGTLALHRNSMHEACPLKTRHYLAHGLPVVIGYDDTDFLDLEPWYLLRLPNTESNVSESVESIRAFIRRGRDERVGRSEIAERIDLAPKEKRRLAFMRALLEEDEVRGSARTRRHVPRSARA